MARRSTNKEKSKWQAYTYIAKEIYDIVQLRGWMADISHLGIRTTSGFCAWIIIKKKSIVASVALD